MSELDTNKHQEKICTEDFSIEKISNRIVQHNKNNVLGKKQV